MKEVIYVDNNATTAVAPEVFNVMKPFFTELYGNPSSIHSFGGEVASHIEKARRQVANLIGADFVDKNGNNTEILFTSCGTESNSSAILSAIAIKDDRKKIVTSEVEHPAVLNLCKELERKGYTIEYIPVDDNGRIDLDLVRKVIDENTAIVSIMWANNETGTIFPVEKIAQIAKAKGALFHTDAVQAVGKLPINMKESSIDMLSLSGHKLHAPKGVGALYVRRGTRFKSFLLGGHQEFGRRAGTENVPSIVALGQACKEALEHIADETTNVKKLRDYLEERVVELIPEIGINGDLENRLPNTSSISFKFIEGEAILLLLNQYGICASSGSACTTGSLEPSHVLRAMHLPYTSAHGTIRFSFSRYNTMNDVEVILKHLPDVITTLRNISPFWQER